MCWLQQTPAGQIRAMIVIISHFLGLNQLPLDNLHQNVRNKQQMTSSQVTGSGSKDQLFVGNDSGDNFCLYKIKYRIKAVLISGFDCGNFQYLCFMLQESGYG